jgi:hypothetical protein
METKYMVKYYHPDMLHGDRNLETLIIGSALEAFLSVLLLKGYVIIEIL